MMMNRRRRRRHNPLNSANHQNLLQITAAKTQVSFTKLILQPEHEHKQHKPGIKLRRDSLDLN